jgi:nucleoside-diphosphate-sugar epimerase
MAKQRMIVTGGTGKAGRWIVKHLVERGYGTPISSYRIGNVLCPEDHDVEHDLR